MKVENGFDLGMCVPDRGYYTTSQYSPTFVHGSAANDIVFVKDGNIVIDGNFSGTEPELPEVVSFGRCEDTCLSCKGPTDKDCTSCWAGKRLNVAREYRADKDPYPYGTCETMCANSKYVATTLSTEETTDQQTFWAKSGGWICKNCHDTCYDCTGPLETECQICRYSDSVFKSARLLSQEKSAEKAQRYDRIT